MTAALDLQAEMAAAALAVKFRSLEWLAAQGVPRPTIARLYGAGDLGVTQAAWGQSGLWEPGGGTAHLVLAVRDREGEIEDMLVFRAADPDRWAQRRGAAWLLGADQFHRVRWLDGAGPLRIFGTPLAWLQAGCCGICVLDWCSEAVTALRGLGPAVTLVAEDEGAAVALLDLLRWRDLPGVEVSGRGAAQLQRRVEQLQQDEARERAEREAEDRRRIRDATGWEEFADELEREAA